MIRIYAIRIRYMYVQYSWPYTYVTIAREWSQSFPVKNNLITTSLLCALIRYACKNHHFHKLTIDYKQLIVLILCYLPTHSVLSCNTQISCRIPHNIWDSWFYHQLSNKTYWCAYVNPLIIFRLPGANKDGGPDKECNCPESSSSSTREKNAALASRLAKSVWKGDKH